MAHEFSLPLELDGTCSLLENRLPSPSSGVLRYLACEHHWQGSAATHLTPLIARVLIAADRPARARLVVRIAGLVYLDMAVQLGTAPTRVPFIGASTPLHPDAAIDVEFLGAHNPRITMFEATRVVMRHSLAWDPVKRTKHSRTLPCTMCAVPHAVDACGARRMLFMHPFSAAGGGGGGAWLIGSSKPHRAAATVARMRIIQCIVSFQRRVVKWLYSPEGPMGIRHCDGAMAVLSLCE